MHTYIIKTHKHIYILLQSYIFKKLHTRISFTHTHTHTHIKAHTAHKRYVSLSLSLTGRRGERAETCRHVCVCIPAACQFEGTYAHECVDMDWPLYYMIKSSA